MRIKRLALFSVALICSLTVLPNLGTQLQISAQKPNQKNDAPRYVSLLKRVKVGDNDNYTRLFRVETLVPGEEVTISWKLIPSPESKDKRPV